MQASLQKSMVITDILKGKSQLSDNFQLVEMSRHGIKKDKLTAFLQNVPSVKKEMERVLHISTKTIQRLGETESFSPVISERIIYLFRVFNRGIQVFGTKDKFVTWITRESIALGNLKPVDLLDTGFGFEIILNELGRIEHGVLA